MNKPQKKPPVLTAIDLRKIREGQLPLERRLTAIERRLTRLEKKKVNDEKTIDLK